MIQADVTYTKIITMVTEICCNCGVPFGLPSDLQENLKNDSNKWFYCPNGHRQHYSKTGQTDEEIESEANAFLIVKLLDLIDRAYHHMKYNPPDKTKMSYNEWECIIEEMTYYRSEYKNTKGAGHRNP